MVMTESFSTGKLEFEKYKVSWVRGGRIKVENLITKLITFYDYSAHVLKSVVELCEEKICSDRDRVFIYVSSAAFELIGEENIEILQDETAFFIIPQKKASETTRKLSIKGEGRLVRHCELPITNCHLKTSSRYILQDDGELTFFEHITPENFGTHYEDPIINVYRVKPQTRK
jgi:hypothetical protein